MVNGVYEKVNMTALCSLQSPVKPHDNIKEFTTLIVLPATPSARSFFSLTPCNYLTQREYKHSFLLAFTLLHMLF